MRKKNNNNNNCNVTIIFNNERVRFVIGRITNKFKSQKLTESNFFYSVYINSLHYFKSC